MQANMSDLCFVFLSFSNCVSVCTCSKTLRQANVFMNKYVQLTTDIKIGGMSPPLGGGRLWKQVCG